VITAKPMGLEESLRWLLSFSKFTADLLTHGRPGDLANLLFDLRRYLQVEPDDKRVEKELARAERDPLILLSTVATVRELLAGVAGKIPFRYRYGRGELVFDAGKLPSDSALSYHDASLRDAVVQVAVDDLSDAAALRVKRCANEKCGEIFFAERRSQIYCGHRCANVIASSTYRNQTEKKEKRRLHARQKYREKSTRRWTRHAK
jgi:hypothetical protein